MKFLLFVIVALQLSNMLAAGTPNPKATGDFSARLAASPINWFEKKVNIVVNNAIKENRVVMDEINEYIFLQVIPNNAYKGDDGEARLGEDITQLLGKIRTGEDAMIMQMQWIKLKEMKLPFKKTLIDAMLFDKALFDKDLDLNFYVEINKLTGRIFESLKREPLFQIKYNSERRFYRIEIKDSKSFYMLHIPNMAYEIIYTGEPFENVIKKYLAEISFLFTIMKKYEKRIAAQKTLQFDGRYIKGKDIFVDAWFLYDYSKGKIEEVDTVMYKVLSGKPVKIDDQHKEKQ